MNNSRRKELIAVVAKIEEAKSELETIRDDEQDYSDNMPESLQGGEKGSAAEEAISNLENALSSLEEAVSSIVEAS